MSSYTAAAQDGKYTRSSSSSSIFRCDGSFGEYSMAKIQAYVNCLLFFLNVGPAADGISISSPFDPSVAQLEITTIPAVVWK